MALGFGVAEELEGFADACGIPVVTRGVALGGATAVDGGATGTMAVALAVALLVTLAVAVVVGWSASAEPLPSLVLLLDETANATPTMATTAITATPMSMNGGRLGAALDRVFSPSPASVRLRASGEERTDGAGSMAVLAIASI